MADVNRGYSFGATETVTNTKLHTLVDDATVTGIVDADIASGANISFSKIASGSIDGSRLTGLGNITSGAGIIPAANLPSTSAIPSGLICIWKGSVATIPSGWVICDGNNGTPDLRSKFVVCAGSTYSVNDTGGAATHTLTTAEMPAHTHGVNVGNNDDTDNGNAEGQSYHGAEFNTTSTGGGGAHNNLPPYFALAYIMKS